MKEKLVNLIKDNNLFVPKLLLYNYKELKITEKELVFLIYVINEKDLTFNPKKISIDLKESLEDIMNIFELLVSKNLLKLDNTKTNGVRTETIDINPLYTKLSHLIIVEEEPVIETSIYTIFEEKFGRTLSPMEYAIIGGWLDSNYNEETIILALDEAIYNQVYKLNYIDKILYEWNKKGIKNKEDKLKNDIDFKTKKTEKKELIDYNWLEDE